jgi:hypothetical protein
MIEAIALRFELEKNGDDEGLCVSDHSPFWLFSSLNDSAAKVQDERVWEGLPQPRRRFEARAVTR